MGSPKTKGKSKSSSKESFESLADNEVVMEFGGPIGCIFVMVFSHLFVYYVWICLRFYEGAIAHPSSFDDIIPFLNQQVTHVIEGATPTLYSAKIYGGFIVFEAILAIIMPGLKVKGLPVPSEGNKKLIYNCNGITSWYVTLMVVAALHYTNIFPLGDVTKNLGPILSTAIIFADIVAVLAYISAHVRGKAHRVSGNIIYDFFMGLWLNPRLFGNFDLKFWAETRVSWIMLFLLTASAATLQYEIYGFVSNGMIFMLVAHGLYANACMKGEECIPTTWDIFYEKWGWMLIYWNLAGVPFFYCSCSMFILIHTDDLSISTPVLIANLIALFIAYYIWDTSQSQRNRFRMKLRGTFVKRSAFPQLPWGTLEKPKYLETKCGSKLLIDGWWAYARKIHYTCDVVMALTWGIACGFSYYLPYLYFSFFIAMISHRYSRDIHRCARKYGDDWDKYTKCVPYAFVPYVF